LELHFAPDDAWLVVQDGGSSLGISLRLFRRDRGAAYKELEQADIEGKAERIALEEQEDAAGGLLDHRYMKLVAWSGDSRSFLFSLSGHGGDANNHVRITGWMGIYDVESGEIALELSKLNRGVVEKRPAQK
jgi:hypothetical protein